MRKNRKKLLSKLVERPRQKKGWGDVIFPVPHYADPTIHGKHVAVALRNLVYCLNADFGYAKDWEFDLRTPIAETSSPQWWGDSKIALTALLFDGRYQWIVIDLETKKVIRRTLIKGKPYEPCCISEDRYPISPVVAGNDLVLISPYGHVETFVSNRRISLGRNLKVGYEAGVVGQFIVFHVANDRHTWLEWRKIDTLEKVLSSEKYETTYGITTGYVGTSLLVLERSVVCGFGDRLVCFDYDGGTAWEFLYPRIESLDEVEPLKIVTSDGKTIHQTTSEVDVGSNLYSDGTYLYFVLSESTRHISYLTKMDISTGKAIWTCKIEGLSAASWILDVSSKDLLLQNEKRLWIVAQDGSIRNEVELDIDCASCSNLVRLMEDKYLLLADFGVHEVRVDLQRLYAKPVSRATGTVRQVFLAHASEDKTAIVQPFYEECERKSISAWFDAAEIGGGDRLIKKIEEGLSKSKCVVLFLSKDFLRKPWPQKELEAALSMEIQGKKVVFPILLGISHKKLQKKHPLLALITYEHVDNYDPKKRVEDKEIEEIVCSLEKLLQG